MEIFFSPYSLIKKNMQGVQKGCLLKVVEANQMGVADICPKTDLGDLSLQQEITNKGPLFQRALALATEDLQARQSQKSLLFDKPIKNNFLITDFKLGADIPENCTVKIKGSSDVAALSSYLHQHISKFSQIRIDFNAKLKVDEFEWFLKSLSADLLKKIQYIEDPTVVSANWLKWNQIVPLASDFQRTENLDFYKYRIVKPARDFLPEKLNHFTLTSAMDHPVGVAHGLRAAQQLAQNDSGFLTLDLYADCGFNRYYNQEGLFLNFSKLALNDFGIGMTEELNKQIWTTLDGMSFD